MWCALLRDHDDHEDDVKKGTQSHSAGRIPPGPWVVVSSGSPASDLAVQPPAASTDAAVDLTAGATIREDPGSAAATAAAAAAAARRARASYTAAISCLHCCTLHESVAVFLWKWMDVNMNTIFYYCTAFIRPGIRV